MLEAGIPEETIRAVCGHVSEQMIRRYSHIRMKSKLAAVQAIIGKPESVTEPRKRKYFRIMVNCPNESRLAFTGIATEQEAFNNQVSTYSSTFTCPECGQPHTWENAMRSCCPKREEKLCQFRSMRQSRLSEVI
jgi:hypothetical protein